MSNTKRTELKDLGEFGLIDHLTKDIHIKHKDTILGVGDDTAVIKKDKRDSMLITKDLLVEGIHFDLSYCPLKHLGYKAAVVNFSDIFAMNGVPKQIVVGIAISNRFSLEAVNELYEGIKLACEVYDVDLVGGDTTSSLQGLFISITAVGQVETNRIAYRSGAQNGDLLCVSGDLGAAYMGLLLLNREKTVFKNDPNSQPELEGNDYILSRQLKPEARQDIIAHLDKLDIIPTSMIDISDGLASEISHICDKSDVGCVIYEEKIPIAPETKKMAELLSMHESIAALNGGEDYELLFTIKQDDYEKMKDIAEIKIIGHITEDSQKRHLKTKGGELIDIKAQGFTHM